MWFYIDSMEKTHTQQKKNRREDHGGEGVHIVETRMFCTVCLKSSCLLICFHSWNLDLSQTLIQTIQILKEGKKTGPKPWKKQKTTKSFTPCHLSSFPSDPLHGSKLFGFFCFFLFFFVFFWFSRGFCNCVSPNNISCSFFVFFVFLFLGFLGEIFTLTNIHWHSFHPSTFYIDVFIELLILATEPSENMYSKNSSTLSPTSSGTPLDWCFIGMPRFWFLMFRGLARVLQTWNH